MSIRVLVLLALLFTAQLCLGSDQTPAFRPIVPASTIVALLEEGKTVDLTEVQIKGSIDLMNLDPPQVKSNIVMDNCSISILNADGITFEKEMVLTGCDLDKVSMNNTVFLHGIDMSGSRVGEAGFFSAQIDDMGNFQSCTFAREASFEAACFIGDALFYGAVFIGPSNFNYSVMEGYGTFTEVQFLQEALFSDIETQSLADFSGSTFSGPAIFLFSYFHQGVAFLNSTFKSKAHFGMTRFEGFVSFTESQFEDEANFGLVWFERAADFRDVRFLGDAIFGVTKFEGLATFSGAEFQGDLNLKSAAIPSILLDNVTFQEGCQVILKGADFGRLTAPWSDIRKHMTYDGASYIAMVKNYKDLEWFVDADNCYYDYRFQSMAGKPWGWTKLIDILAWISCGYGVRPSYTVVLSLALIASFGYIFYKGRGLRRAERSEENEESEENLEGRIEPTEPGLHYPTIIEALYFSSLVFISQAPVDFLAHGRYRGLVILEGLLGWLFLALFLVTLGNIMIR